MPWWLLCPGCGERVDVLTDGVDRIAVTRSDSSDRWSIALRDVHFEEHIIHTCDSAGGEAGDREPRIPIESPPLASVERDGP
jgi:hypothetical protein